MKVNVYLSYYNGSKYIDEQIDSLLNQKDVEVQIFIRNDGSNANESDYLRKYDYENRVTVFHGENVGFGKSFLNLVANVKEKADYYAFCDQDDVWLDFKLKAACSKIKLFSGPVAYCALPKYVDSDLNPLDGMGTVTDCIHLGVMSVDDALQYQLFGIGCTYVWNNELNEILQKIDLKEFAFAHDNFISLLTPFVGTFYRDDLQPILYRQHEKNVSGCKKKNKSLYKKLFGKFRNFNNQTGFLIRKYVAENAGCYIDSKKKYLLMLSVCYRDKLSARLKLIRYVLSTQIDCKKKIKNLLMIMGNRY